MDLKFKFAGIPPRKKLSRSNLLSNNNTTTNSNTKSSIPNQLDSDLIGWDIADDLDWNDPEFNQNSSHTKNSNNSNLSNSIQSATNKTNQSPVSSKPTSNHSPTSNRPTSNHSPVSNRPTSNQSPISNPVGYTNQSPISNSALSKQQANTQPAFINKVPGSTNQPTIPLANQPSVSLSNKQKSPVQSSSPTQSAFPKNQIQNTQSIPPKSPVQTKNQPNASKSPVQPPFSKSPVLSNQQPFANQPQGLNKLPNTSKSPIQPPFPKSPALQHSLPIQASTQPPPIPKSPQNKQSTSPKLSNQSQNNPNINQIINNTHLPTNPLQKILFPTEHPTYTDSNEFNSTFGQIPGLDNTNMPNVMNNTGVVDQGVGYSNVVGSSPKVLPISPPKQTVLSPKEKVLFIPTPKQTVVSPKEKALPIPSPKQTVVSPNEKALPIPSPKRAVVSPKEKVLSMQSPKQTTVSPQKTLPIPSPKQTVVSPQKTLPMSSPKQTGVSPQKTLPMSSPKQTPKEKGFSTTQNFVSPMEKIPTMSAPPQQQNPGSPNQKTTSPNQKTSPIQLHDQPLILTSAPDFHHTHTQPHIQSERQSANPIFPEQSPLFQHHSNAPNGMVQAHLEHNLPSHNENSNYTQHVNGVGEYGGANQIGQVPNTNELTQQIQTDNQSIGQELPYGDQHLFVESVNAKVEPHPIGGSVYQYQDHQQGYETQHQYNDQIAYAEGYQQPDAGQVYGDYQDQIQGDYQGYGQEYGQHDYQGPVQGQGDYQEQNPVDYQGQANYQEQNPIDYQNQTSYQEQNPIDYQNQTSYQEQNPVDYQNQNYQEQNPVDYQNQNYQEQNQVGYGSQANYQEQGQDSYPDQSQVNYQAQNQVYQEQNPVDYQSQGQTNYQDQNQVQGEYPYQNQFGYQDQNQADYQGQVQHYQYENPAYGDQNQPYEDQTQTNYQEFSNQSQYPDVSQHPYSQPNEWQPQYQQPYPTQGDQLNSEAKQSSPQVGYNASPKIVNASPKIVNASPKIVNASPKIVNASPKIVNTSPKLVNESPKLVNESPKVVNESPKLPNVSANASPKIAQGSPKVGANVSPKLAPQASPKITQTSPKLVNQPPPQPSYNQAQFTAAAPYHSQPPSDVGTNQNSAFDSTTATMDAQADGQHDFGFDQVNEYPAEAYQPDAGVQPFEQPQYGTGVEYGNENTYEYQTEYTQQEYQGDMGYENQEYTDPQVQSQHPITDYQAQHVDPYNNQPVYTIGDGQLDPNFVNQQVPTDMQQPQMDYNEHTQVDYTESTQVYHNQYQTDPQHQLDDFQSSSEPKYKICNQCGKQYDFDNNFCGRCGCALVEYQPKPQAELHAPLPPTQPVFQPVQAPVDHMLSLDSPSYHAFPNLSVAPVVSYPISNLQAPVTNHQPVVATNVVDSTPKDPRLRGHCFAIFGFGGKLLVMKPKRQTMYQTNSSGVPTSVEKVYPGMLQVENISQYVYENVIQDAKAPLGVSGPLFTSSKIKKKVLLDQLDEYITKYDHPSTVNHTLIAKYLRLIIETELLVNGKPNPIIQQQVLELLKSNRIEEKTPIDQIRNLLMQGSRESACTVAVNTNLWAEALIIATNISPDMYRDVIMQMMRSGYGSTYNLEQKYPALKVLLASFGGVGHTAVNEFLKPEVLRQDGLWKDCLSLLIANRSMNDGPTLTALIDQLNQNGFIPAAQLTSFIVDGPGSLSGIENPKSKIVLINGNHIKYPTSFFRNPELIRLTEIVESYLMLKGQWGTSTMPYFQAYKLWYVGYLADLGLVEQSARYIESLTTLGKVFQQPSPYIHKMFGDRLKELSDRLMITCDGAKHISKESSTGSWFGKIGGNLTGAALGQGIQRLMDSAVGLNEPEIASSNGSQSSLFPLPGTESYVKDSSPKSQPSSLSKPVHLNEPYPEYDTHGQQFSGYAGNTNASQQQYNQQPMAYQPQDGNSYDQYQGETYNQYPPTEQPYQEEQYYNQQTEQYQEQTEQYYEQQNEQQYNNFQPDSNYGYQTDPNYNQQYDQYDQSQQYQDTDNYNTQEITNDYNNEAVDPSQNMNDYNPMQETGHVNQWQPSHVSPPTTSAPPEGNIAAYQPNHISPPPTASVPPIGNVAAYHPNTSLPAEEDLGFGNPPAKKTEVYEDEDLGFGNPKPTQKSAYDQNDDLGLGNSKTSMKPPVPPPTENAVPPAKENEKPTTDSKPAPAPAPARSGIFASVLSLFGGKKEDQPVSHKAHLPSGSSFYFDEKTKKWVNKNSNSAEKEEEVQAPPPIMPAGVNNTRPPNAASEPTANVPFNNATLPVAPTPGGDLPPMPMGGSRANKRKGKSRYVDVLNDGGDTNAKASVQAFVPSFSAQNSQVTMMTPMAVPTQPAHNVQQMKPQGVAKPPSPSRIASNMSGFQPPSSPSRVVSSASGFQAPPSPSRIASSASGFQPPPSPTRMVSGTSAVHPPPSPSRLHPNGPGIPVPKPGPPIPSHSNAPIARNINPKGPIPMNPNMMPPMPFNQAKSTASMQSTVSNVGGRAGRPGSNHSSPMIGKRQGRQGAPPPDL